MDRHQYMHHDRDKSDHAPPAPLPLAQLGELVTQYHHRLFSLEIDLKDGARSGLMDAGDFSRRVRHLKEALKHLKELQTACDSESQGATSRSDIGLPLLERCTPMERDVCAAFLDDRDLLLLAMKNETGKVLRWLRAAISGRANPIAMIFRLSKLRRYIQTHEVGLSRVAETTKQQHAQIERWLGQIKSGRERDASRTTLDTLVDVFDELDGTTSRVAKLRAAVKREETRNRSMIAWLAQEERQSRAVPTPQPPPSPLDTIKVVAARELGSASTKRQRQLVERYWQDVIQGDSPAPAPTDRSVQNAAKLLAIELSLPGDNIPSPSRKTRRQQGRHR